MASHPSDGSKADCGLLLGLAGIDRGRRQRFTLPWAILLSLILMAAALAYRVMPLSA